MPQAQNLWCKTSLDLFQQMHHYKFQLYGGKWVGKKKRDFVNIAIYTYESLGNVRHIRVGKPVQLSTDTTTTDFTTVEQLWSKLYEKRCELKVYC